MTRTRDDPDRIEPRIREYWSWIAVALFLLIPLDLLTSLAAASMYGLEAESNPIMAWLLARSLPVIVAVNLAAVGLAAGCFAGVAETLRRTPPPYRRYFALLVELWLALLVASGVALFANNFAVIILGRSLV